MQKRNSLTGLPASGIDDKRKSNRPSFSSLTSMTGMPTLGGAGLGNNPASVKNKKIFDDLDDDASM